MAEAGPVRMPTSSPALFTTPMAARAAQPAAPGHARGARQLVLRHAHRLLQLGDVGLGAAQPVGAADQEENGDDHFGRDQEGDDQLGEREAGAAAGLAAGGAFAAPRLSAT